MVVLVSARYALNVNAKKLNEEGDIQTKRMRKSATLALAALVLATISPMAAEIPDPLPDPDGKPADMTKKVQVYILMGQSNMLGFGNVGALKNATGRGLYPYLVDDGGNWTVRKDVRNVRLKITQRGERILFHNEFMIFTAGNFGPEIGIGHYVGHVTDAPVMMLKSCTGNRSLGWDLLPPGSERYEFEGRIYAGYKDSPENWAKGTEPRRIGWYGGKQYDDDIAAAKEVLANLDNHYPGAIGYEVAGFCWWQGDKDSKNRAHAAMYEKNLVALIKQLRKEFNAPKANFVIATLGQTRKDAGGTEGQLINAMFAVDGDSGKYPEFKGNVKTFYSNPVSKGGRSTQHYGGNPETYMNVGEGMGKAMAELILAGGGASEPAKK